MTGARGRLDARRGFRRRIRRARPRSACRGDSTDDRLDLGRHHVARKFDIDRQRQFARAAQHARDLRGRGCGIGQHRLIAGDLPEDGELRVDGAGLVMQQEAAGSLARAGRARDHHHRRALRIGARDRIDDIEGAGAVGHDGDAEAAVIARRRIRCETDGRLVAQREIRQDVAFFDDLEQRQHEIAGNAEDLAGAVILQRGEQSMGKRGHRSVPGIRRSYMITLILCSCKHYGSCPERRIVRAWRASERF